MRTATVIPISIQRIICNGCGAETNAACNCGVAYQPKSVRAREAVMANPEKSDRAIAEEIGTSPTTIGKAREQLSSGGQLDKESKRIGLDGKTRKLPRTECSTEEKELIRSSLFNLHRTSYKLISAADYLSDFLEGGMKFPGGSISDCSGVVQHCIDSLTRLAGNLGEKK